MKKLFAVLLSLLCAALLILPAAADIIWEPPEDIEPLPDETVPLLSEPEEETAPAYEADPEPEANAEQIPPLVVGLTVGVVIVAAALIGWLIVRRRTAGNGAEK